MPYNNTAAHRHRETGPHTHMHRQTFTPTHKQTCTYTCTDRHPDTHTDIHILMHSSMTCRPARAARLATARLQVFTASIDSSLHPSKVIIFVVVVVYTDMVCYHLQFEIWVSSKASCF